MGNISTTDSQNKLCTIENLCASPNFKKRKSESIQTLNKNNEKLNFISNLQIWRIYHKKGKNYDELISIENFKKFDKKECYIVLHAYKLNQQEKFSMPILSKEKNNTEKNEENNNGNKRSLRMLVDSSYNSLTPRGISSIWEGSSLNSGNMEQIVKNKNMEENKEFAYDLYIWNGMEASSLTKAFSLAKCFLLEKKLTNGQDIYKILFEISPISVGSLFIDEIDIEGDLMNRGTKNHLFNKLFNQYPSFLKSPRKKSHNDRSQDENDSKSDSPKVFYPSKFKFLRKSGFFMDEEKDEEEESSSYSDSTTDSDEDDDEESEISEESRYEPEGEDSAERGEGLTFILDDDFSSSGEEPDPEETPPQDNVSQRVRLEFYERRISMVTPSIFLGGLVCARKRKWLKKRGVTHIVNLASMIRPHKPFPEDFIYKTYYLLDSKNANISTIFLDAIEFMDEAIENGGKIYVHCQQGVSRSCTIVLMYLMWKEKITYMAIENKVKSIRKICSPNPGFIMQLILWQKRLFEPVTQPLVFQITSQSSYQPGFMVPFMLMKPLKSNFTDETVFIVQTKDTLYIWVGSNSHKIDLESAHKNVKLFQKYLNAPKTVIEVEQGKEESSFWDICFPPVVKKSPRHEAPKLNTQTNTPEKVNSPVKMPPLKLSKTPFKLELGGLNKNTSDKVPPLKLDLNPKKSPRITPGLKFKLDFNNIRAAVVDPSDMDSGIRSHRELRNSKRTPRKSPKNSFSGGSRGSKSSDVSDSDESSLCSSSSSRTPRDHSSDTPPDFNSSMDSVNEVVPLPSPRYKNSPLINSPRNKIGKEKGFDLPKLNLLGTKNTEISETTENKLSARKNEKHIFEILPHLYLSKEAVSRDKKILLEHNITHIVNCAGNSVKNTFSSEKNFKYKTYFIKNNYSESVESLFCDFISFVDSTISQDGNVLVHGEDDWSVSVSLLFSYLICVKHKSYNEAFQLLSENINIKIIESFEKQLLSWEARFKSKTPSKSVIFYQMIKQSTKTPLFVVPLKVATPKKEFFSIHTEVYILETPKSFFVWKGGESSGIHYESAKKTVQFFKKYIPNCENKPLVEVSENEEPKSFWEEIQMNK